MELDLNIDSNGNVIVNTLSEYVAYPLVELKS